MDEQDKTKKIYSLEELNSIQDQAIKEITGENKIIEPEVINEELLLEKKKREKKPNFFKRMNKKQRIIFITMIIVFVVALSILSYFLFFNKNVKKDDDKPENIIINKENYRYENGKLVFLEGSRELGSYTCKNQNVSNCYLASYSNNEDNFNVTKQVYEDLSDIIETSDFINNQYAFIIDVENLDKPLITIYDFINKMNVATVKAIKYYGINNDVIIKSEKNLYGLFSLETTGFTKKIDCLYDYLGIITEGKEDEVLVAKSNDFWSLISYQNETITKNYRMEIKNYNSEYVVLSDGNYNYLYDYQNKIVFDDKYSYIRLMDEYVAIVNDLDLFIYDYDGNKYNDKAIKLNSTDYNPIYLYSVDGTNKGVKGSFNVNVFDNNIKVCEAIDDTRCTTLNLFEGKLSQKLSYANYFNGTYTFYSDETKTNKIGEYTCTNKNNITELTNEENIYNQLSDCYLAFDSIYENNDMALTDDVSIGAIPIFDNTFVFISDNANGTEKKTIKLYNLKTNKIVGNYLNVSTYQYTGVNNISFVNDETVNVIARNKDNKTGMIKISNGEVKAAIPFNYISLEKLGKEAYMAKTSNAKYVVIFNDTATNISKEFNGPIKGYNSNYFKVLENNKYNIYDYSGKKINTNSYKYIELEGTYYIGVDDANELKVYNYLNEEVISEGITLYSSNYSNSVEKAFYTELNGNVLNIRVLKEQDYQEYNFDISTGLRVEG